MKRLIHIIVFLVALKIPALCFGQQGADSLFQTVRALAEKGSYTDALNALKPLRNKFPDNNDYALYEARLYLWSGKADSCVWLLDGLSAITNWEKETLYAQAHARMGNYNQALDANRRAGKLVPDSEKVPNRLREADILSQLDRDSEALELLDSLSQLGYLSKDVAYLRTGILQKKKNRLTVGYLNTSFTQPGFAPLQFFHLEYKRNERRIAYVARLNCAYAFQVAAIQGEVDLYPKIGKRGYVYLNAGLSDQNSIFPFVRLGVEPFYERNRFSASFGGRFFAFQNNNVGILTGHFSYNPNNWRFSYRPYFVLEQIAQNLSHVVQVRRTLSNQENYLQIDLQYGTTPYYYWVDNDLTRISAYRIGLSVQWRIGDNFFVLPALMYELEEYFPGLQRNRFNTQLQLTKRF